MKFHEFRITIALIEDADDINDEDKRECPNEGFGYDLEVFKKTSISQNYKLNSNISSTFLDTESSFLILNENWNE